MEIQINKNKQKLKSKFIFSIVSITYIFIYVQHLITSANYNNEANVLKFFNLGFLPSYFEYMDELLILTLCLVSPLLLKSISINKKYIPILLILIPFSIGSVINGINIFQAILGLRSIYQNFIFVLIVFLLIPKHKVRLLKFFGILCLINLLVIILIMITNYFFNGTIFLLDTGTGIIGPGHTHLAAYMNMLLLILVLFNTLYIKYINKKVLVGLLLTTSLLMEPKAGFIALLIVLFFYLIKYEYISWKMRLKMIPLSIMFLLGSYLFMKYSFDIDLTRTYSSDSLYKSQTIISENRGTGGKVVSYIGLYNEVLNNNIYYMLFGRGSGNFLSASSMYFGGITWKDLIPINIENVQKNSGTPFLVVLVGEFGIIGLILFILFLYRLYKHVKKYRFNKNLYNFKFSLFLGVLFLFILGISENIMEQQQTSIIFWLFSLLIISDDINIYTWKPINIFSK